MSAASLRGGVRRSVRDALEVDLGEIAALACVLDGDAACVPAPVEVEIEIL
jgi:hypothetical protein